MKGTNGLTSYPGGETKMDQRKLPTERLVKVKTKEVDSLISCPGDEGRRELLAEEWKISGRGEELPTERWMLESVEQSQGVSGKKSRKMEKKNDKNSANTGRLSSKALACA